MHILSDLVTAPHKEPSSFVWSREVYTMDLYVLI